jgi:hypothetical protein
MDEEEVSAAEVAANGFWTALADDDDASVERLLSPPALAEVGAGDGLARRARERLGLGPRECRNAAVLRDVALKGFVDIGAYDDGHRIEYMIADLVDDVSDKRLVAGQDAAMTSTWTLDVMQSDHVWTVDWDERN